MVTAIVTTQSIADPVSVVDMALGAGLSKFDLSVENVQHEAAGPRALYLAFSIDGADTFGAMVAVSSAVAASTNLNLNVEFFLSPEAARTATSTENGSLGAIVPGGGADLRIGFAVGGEFTDDFTAGTLRLNGAA